MAPVGLRLRSRYSSVSAFFSIKTKHNIIAKKLLLLFHENPTFCCQVGIQGCNLDLAGKLTASHTSPSRSCCHYWLGGCGSLHTELDLSWLIALAAAVFSHTDLRVHTACDAVSADVDECPTVMSDANNTCHQCINVAGSYRCDCNAGYKIKDKIACEGMRRHWGSCRLSLSLSISLSLSRPDWA